MKIGSRLVGLGLLTLASSACGSREPRAIQYGEDLCDQCHMTIADPAFAAQLVTKTGKVYVFGDIAELATFAERVSSDDVHRLWVNLFLNPDERVAVEHAVFLRSDRLRSPMASGLAAFRSHASADSMRTAIGGELLAWSDVVRHLDSLPVVVTR